MMSDAQTSCEIVRFGAFTLDMRRRVLTLDGVPVPLDDKPLDLLIFLVTHREAAVSREAILAHVWRGRTVDVANVAVQLSALRSALKHAGCRDRLILTQPGPCYRFVADVTEELPSPPPSPPQAIVARVAADPVPAAAESRPRRSRGRRLGSVAAGTAAVAALLLSALTNLPGWFSHPPAIPRLSMVVLPFRNPGPDRDQDYLARAITDDLTSDLAHVPESVVIDGKSAAAARGPTPQAIGQSLRVRYVVGGTLHHEDATYRVTAYLIDTATGVQLWNLQFVVTDGRLATARDTIVSHIAGALNFQLYQVDESSSPVSVETLLSALASRESGQTRGHRLAAQVDESSSPLSADELVRRLRPSSDDLLRGAERGMRRLPLAVRSAAPTMEASKRPPELRDSRGSQHGSDSQDLFFRARARLDVDATLTGLSEAQSMLERAIVARPDFADARAELAWLLLRKATLNDPDTERDYASAKSSVMQVLAGSPHNSMALTALAKLYQTDGRCDEARASAAQALAIDNSSVEAHSVLAECAMVEASFDEANRQYEIISRLDPEGVSNRSRFLDLGYISIIEGRFEKAIDLLSRAGQDQFASNPATGMSAAEQVQLGLIAALELDGQHWKAVARYNAFSKIWPWRTTWRLAGYLPEKWRDLLGTRSFLQALRTVGMPQFSRDTDGATWSTSACGAGDFALTPISAPKGFRLASTADVMHWREGPENPLIIDLGRGMAAIDQAQWRNPTDADQSAAEYAVDVADQQSQSNRDRLIVTAGDGPTGCAAFQAADALSAHGYRNVAWYRGGEEAWAVAGQPSDDRRTQ